VIVTDVNPLVYAFRPDTQFHQLARAALDHSRRAGELIVLPDVAAAFVRIVTDPRITENPDELADALAFVDAVTNDGRFLREAHPSRWTIFHEFVDGSDVRAGLIPDALLAATCQDFGAAILTADRDFLTFSGLRVHLMTRKGLIDHTVT
jgi:toxin-antitoxin system PIN domain toxin